MEAFNIQITWKLWANASISGLFAALVTAFVTWSIQRFGGVIGGVIATVPSSIVPTAIGLALTLTGDDEDYTIALYCVPVGVMLNALLLVMWRVILPRLHFLMGPRKRVIFMVILSILAWLAMATILGIILSHVIRRGMLIRIPALICLGVSILIWIVVSTAGVSIGAKGEGKVSIRVYIIGAVVGGVAAFLAIFLAAFSDVASGLSISFPAVLLTSMVALSLSHTDSLSVSATTSMIGGMLSIATYAVIMAELLEPLDEAFGGQGHWAVALLASAIDWILCVAFVSLPVGLFIRCRERASKRSIGRIIFESDSETSSEVGNARILEQEHIAERPSRNSSMILFRDGTGTSDHDSDYHNQSESPSETYFSTTPTPSGKTFLLRTEHIAVDQHRQHLHYDEDLRDQNVAASSSAGSGASRRLSRSFDSNTSEEDSPLLP